jgi:hypothetical protein
VGTKRKKRFSRFRKAKFIGLHDTNKKRRREDAHRLFFEKYNHLINTRTRLYPIFLKGSLFNKKSFSLITH